eukprot:2907493-Ditylum_brightwellii.AAC.1
MAKVPQLPHHSFVLATLPESLKGLGLYAPHRSAVASLIIPLARTICQAVNGIQFAEKSRATLSPYLQSVYKD